MSYELDWDVLIQYRHLFWQGLQLTFTVAGLSLLLSFSLGSVIGTARHFLPRPLVWIFVGYIELFRNIPPIVQLFFWYFAAGLDSLAGAVVGLSVYSSSYMGEAVRSGYRSIAITQIEAARSTGLSFVQMIRYVVFPQAIIRMIPALSVESINVIKNSSLAMTLGVMELTFQTQEINARTFRGFEAATAVTVAYMVIGLSFGAVMHGVERAVRLNVRGG